VKRTAIPYPCVGYCIIDSRGYCTACGRPPTLGAPENSAIGKASREPPQSGTVVWPESQTDKPWG